MLYNSFFESVLLTVSFIFVEKTIHMKKLRLLTITFTEEIQAFEIPAFRGAIIDKVGQENILFHNHLSQGFLYKYPLIQYKIINKKPAIVCVDFGIDEIHKFFEKRDWSIRFSGRTLDMKIENLNMNQFTMQVWDKMFSYSIRDWVALNPENYEKFKIIETPAEQNIFLANVMKANILSFAKGVEWTIEKPIKLEVTEIIRSKKLKVKGNGVLGLDVNFKCNVFLPNNIGLGKSVSMGYGVVKQLRVS